MYPNTSLLYKLSISCWPVIMALLWLLGCSVTSGFWTVSVFLTKLNCIHRQIVFAKGNILISYTFVVSHWYGQYSLKSYHTCANHCSCHPKASCQHGHDPPLKKSHLQEEVLTFQCLVSARSHSLMELLHLWALLLSQFWICATAREQVTNTDTLQLKSAVATTT